MNQKPDAPAWSDEAHLQGLAAGRAAEAALIARRTPAEKAREPLPAELDHLHALEAAVALAVLDREAAEAAVRAAWPRPSDDEPGAPRRSFSAAVIAEAQSALARADDLERLALVAETAYRQAMSAAGTARAAKISTSESKR